MKNLLSLILPVALCVTGCNMNEQTAIAIMKNPKMQQDIFDVITADSALNAKMLDQMMDSKLSRSIMQSHLRASRLMCTPARLDSMSRIDAEMDTILLNFVHCRIDQDSAWCRKLTKIIQEKDNTRTGLKKTPQ